MEMYSDKYGRAFERLLTCYDLIVVQKKSLSKSYLSELLNVSKRTINNYIFIINAFLADTYQMKEVINRNGLYRLEEY